jgi:uncharacterized protein YjbI with pentapeptide repeats
MPDSTMFSSYLSVLTTAERRTSLIGAWLDACRFQDIDLSDSLLEKTRCEAATFEQVNLRRANFRGAVLRRAHFIRCDLTDAVFPGSLVAGAEFVACHGLTAETTRLLCERGATVLPAPPGGPPIGSPAGGSR